MVSNFLDASSGALFKQYECLIRNPSGGFGTNQEALKGEWVPSTRTRRQLTRRLDDQCPILTVQHTHALPQAHTLCEQVSRTGTSGAKPPCRRLHLAVPGAGESEGRGLSSYKLHMALLPRPSSL
eukprot:365904-Chlamydomonas_euryale.AAC.7